MLAMLQGATPGGLIASLPEDIAKIAGERKGERTRRMKSRTKLVCKEAEGEQ